jgi:hypothetical protein
MAVPIVGLLAVAVFALLLAPAGIIAVCRAAAEEARAALAVMGNSALDDRAKETAVRRASLGLFGSLGSILLRAAGVFLASLLPVLLADAVGLAPASAVVAWLSRWDVIAGVTVAMVAVWLAVKLGARALWPRT